MQKIKDYIYYNRKEIIIVTIFILLFIVYLFMENKNNKDDEIINEVVIEEKKEEIIEDNTLIVDIKGEVKSPGTYEIEKDKRVKDVVEDAGGLTDNANTDNVNLSEKVHDEMVIIIPNEDTKDEIKMEDTSKSLSNSKISINNASIDELMKIKGIGKVKAESIVEYRNQNGKFQKIEDIMNVKGIGTSTFEKIKDYIRI